MPGYVHLVLLAMLALGMWLLFTYLYPRLMLLAYRRAILSQGVDAGPVPVNTLYVQPAALFRDPLTPLPKGGSRLLSMGTNRDTLYAVGWLDLSKGPLVLSVPDMDRWYSVQLTDPTRNVNFAYVGTRTTGDAAGRHLLTGPGWTGEVPTGMGHVACPHRAVLLVARVFVAGDDDVERAYDLARRLRLDPAA